MCHTGQFNEHIRLFETHYRGKLKGYHCNSRLYTCIYMYIHYKYVVSSHIRTFIWHHDIWPLSNGIMESFVSSHLKSHFTLDMDHIESCGYFSNDKDIEKALTTSKSLGIFSLYILCSLSICIWNICSGSVHCRLWNIRVSELLYELGISLLPPEWSYCVDWYNFQINAQGDYLE